MELQNSSRGVVNIKNDNNECFRWCHARFLNPQKKKPSGSTNRIEREGEITKFYYEGTEFAVSVKGYAKLECKNRININVIGYEDKEFYPVYISKGSNEDVFNVLVITEGEKKNCVLIKDFNKLMYIIRPKVVIESILAYTVYNVLAQKRCLQSIR